MVVTKFVAANASLMAEPMSKLPMNRLPAAMGIPTKVPKLPVLRVISCKQLPVRPFGLMLVGKSFGV